MMPVNQKVFCVGCTYFGSSTCSGNCRSSNAQCTASTVADYIGAIDLLNSKNRERPTRTYPKSRYPESNLRVRKKMVMPALLRGLPR